VYHDRIYKINENVYNNPLLGKPSMPLSPLLNSGIMLAAISAVILNAYFNGLGTHAEAHRKAVTTIRGSEA
jgi:xanthine/uracil permease